MPFSWLDFRDDRGAEAHAPVAKVHPVIFAAATAPVVFVIVVMMALAVLGEPAAPPEAKIAATDEVRSARRILAQPPLSRGVTPVTPASETAATPVLPIGDAKIVALGIDGSVLAVHTEGPAGREILVYDMTQEAIIQRIRVSADPPMEIGLHAVSSVEPFALSVPSLAPSRNRP